MKHLIRPVTAALLCVLAITACKDKQASKNDPTLAEVKVETRADGLAYAPGATTPFTGKAIELHPQTKEPQLARSTPYLDGRKHGVMHLYTPGGKLREERTYDHGNPLISTIFHNNGNKKTQMQLNAKDLPEGPYKRWYEEGSLMCEGTYDANERFHGEKKDYDKSDKLIGHFKLEHGAIVEVLFETPEKKQERFATPGLISPK